MATLKNTEIGFQDQLSLNAGQKYYRMLQHSTILSTFIKLPFVIKIFVLSIFEWLFYTGFAVYNVNNSYSKSVCAYMSMCACNVIYGNCSDHWNCLNHWNCLANAVLMRTIHLLYLL